MENFSTLYPPDLADALQLAARGPGYQVILIDLDILGKSLAKDSFGILKTFLTNDEVRRHQGFKSPKRQLQWLGGRIACKIAAISLLSRDRRTLPGRLNSLQVETEDHGRPFLPSGHPEISISHSGSLAVGMAGDACCGIDVQEITPRILNVAEKFCSAEEAHRMAEFARLQALTEPQSLTLLWTAKEAIRKMVRQYPLLGFMEMVLSEIAADDSGVLNLALRFSEKDRRRSVRMQAFNYSNFFISYGMYEGLTITT